MTLHSFKLPTSKTTVYYIPTRFLNSQESSRNYKKLMFLFQNMLRTRINLNILELSLKVRILSFKELVMSYRRKYVISAWRPEDSERLHAEMTDDISDLMKEHTEIGNLLYQFKASRK